MKQTSHNIIIQERALELGEKFILCKEATVRSLASSAGVSKSTVHKDLTVRLKELNGSLYKEVSEKLEQNKNERHIRGGEATKKKFLMLKHFK